MQERRIEGRESSFQSARRRNRRIAQGANKVGGVGGTEEGHQGKGHEIIQEKSHELWAGTPRLSRKVREEDGLVLCRAVEKKLRKMDLSLQGTGRRKNLAIEGKIVQWGIREFRSVRRGVGARQATIFWRNLLGRSVSRKVAPFKLIGLKSVQTCGRGDYWETQQQSDFWETVVRAADQPSRRRQEAGRKITQRRQGQVESDGRRTWKIER